MKDCRFSNKMRQMINIKKKKNKKIHLKRETATGQ